MTSPLDGVLPGTHAQWILLAPMLALAGFAAARSRGASAVAGAQRALLLLAAFALARVAFAGSFHAPAFAFAVAPVAGAAVARERPTLAGDARAWLLALAFATPAVVLGALGAAGAAPVGFVLALSALALKGVLEPLYPRRRDISTWWRTRAPLLAHAARRAVLLVAAFAVVSLAFDWPVSRGILALTGGGLLALAIAVRGGPPPARRETWLRALLIAAAAIAIATLGG